MNELAITPHGFGSLTQEELLTLASLLLKAGYTDVGITRTQPVKGKPYEYTVKARRSVKTKNSANTDKNA